MSSPAATHMRPGAGPQVRLPDLQRRASLANATTTGDPSAPCFIYYILHYKSRHHPCEVFRLVRRSTHTQTYTHIHTYLHTYIQTDIHTYRQTYIHSYIHTLHTLHTYIHNIT